MPFKQASDHSIAPDTVPNIKKVRPLDGMEPRQNIKKVRPFDGMEPRQTPPKAWDSSKPPGGKVPSESKPRADGV